NLPDKEFRYLRTVIVTAAVYRGFNSVLAHLLLTFRHRAGVRPYTSSCDFAEPCVFVKQLPPPGLCPSVPVARNGGLLIPKLRRNPWTFGDTVFHSVCRYSCQHSHFRYLQEPSRVSLHWLTERSATARLTTNPKLRLVA